MSRQAKAYIAGIYEHPTRRALDKTVPMLHAEVARGALEEGVTMLSNIVGTDLDGLTVDMPVEVTFGKTENGQALPLFRPVGAGA